MKNLKFSESDHLSSQEDHNQKFEASHGNTTENVFKSVYSFVQPCLAEEAEVIAEKRKNREALERLRQKLRVWNV